MSIKNVVIKMFSKTITLSLLLGIVYFCLVDYYNKNLSKIQKVSPLACEILSVKYYNGLFNSAGFNKPSLVEGACNKSILKLFPDSTLDNPNLQLINIKSTLKNYDFELFRSSQSLLLDLLKKYPRITYLKIYNVHFQTRNKNWKELSKLYSSDFFRYSNFDADYTFYNLFSNGFFNDNLKFNTEELSNIQNLQTSILSLSLSLFKKSIELSIAREKYSRRPFENLNANSFDNLNKDLVEKLSSLDLDSRVRELVRDSVFKKYLTIRYDPHFLFRNPRSYMTSFSRQLSHLSVKHILAIKNYVISQRFTKNYSQPLICNQDYFSSLINLKRELPTEALEEVIFEELYTIYKYRIRRILGLDINEDKIISIIKVISVAHSSMLTLPYDDIKSNWKTIFCRDIVAILMTEFGLVKGKVIDILPELNYAREEIECCY